ncbi:hypothetical protein BC943DRAFT_69924 [Umbelopsis sp. AD052]|nr:hypothetical protein BC943DRAFT_69924 [Umbelopsis sp. AD052]
MVISFTMHRTLCIYAIVLCTIIIPFTLHMFLLSLTIKTCSHDESFSCSDIPGNIWVVGFSKFRCCSTRRPK